MLITISKRQFNILGRAVKSVHLAILLTGFVHACGVAGLLNPSTRAVFEAATPFNLLFSAVLLLFFHRDWNRSFFVFMLITLLAGFLIEVVGVHTGWIFGSYAYGPTLGTQLWGVPLVIGVNWLVLVYCTGIICDKLKAPVFIKVALAALMMVLLDVLIEPVAIMHDYWQWERNEIPLQNYAGWYGASFLLLWIFYKTPFHKQNTFARYLLSILIAFFALLNLLHSAMA